MPPDRAPVLAGVRPTPPLPPFAMPCPVPPVVAGGTATPPPPPWCNGPDRAPVVAEVRHFHPPSPLLHALTVPPCCRVRPTPPPPPFASPDRSPVLQGVRATSTPPPFAMPWDRCPRVAGYGHSHPPPLPLCMNAADPDRAPVLQRYGPTPPPSPPFAMALTCPRCWQQGTPPLPFGHNPDRAPQDGHSTPSTSRANLSPSSYAMVGIPLCLWCSSTHRRAPQQKSRPSLLRAIKKLLKGV
nr:protein diaphanous homolog 1-like [Penaeus vannamei]